MTYLDALEADRKAAIALSEQKAEEAKLIKARQDGFKAAMEILGGRSIVGDSEAVPAVKEPVRRRGRRPIPKIILRELSFSGQPMTTAQIAKAIEYNPGGTETALKRMQSAGQVYRNDDGRWTTLLGAHTNLNGRAVTPAMGGQIGSPQS